jgi:hypothetical protein
MFTQIQVDNHRALVSGATLKKIIMDRLPDKFLKQMHTVDLTGKRGEEIITIITNVGRAAEKCDQVRRTLGLRKPISKVRKEVRKTSRFKSKLGVINQET